MPQIRDDGPTMRRRYRDLVRSQLLDAATTVIETHGEGGFTMAGLADVLQCSIGTLYRHFPSKDAVVQACRLRQLERLQLEEPDGAGSSDQVEALREVAARWADRLAASPSIRELVGSILGRSAPTEADADRSALELALLEPVAAALDRASAGGTLADGDGLTRASLLLGVLLAATRNVGDRDRGTELAALVADCLLLSWGAAASDLPTLRRRMGAG